MKSDSGNEISRMAVRLVRWFSPCFLPIGLRKGSFNVLQLVA